MILIIGGAYQGKLEYATENFPGKKIRNNFHLEVLEDVKQQKSTIEKISMNWEKYKDEVIICEDISCGVVPMDATMRQWREEVGRSTAYLSKRAEKVIRIFCGIGTVLK